MAAGVVRILVRGVVQGVGFRQFTVQQAQRLGVAGWVRNLTSGDVEVLALLPAAGGEGFLAALRRGPPAAQVDALEVTPAPDAEIVPAAGFRVRH